MASPREELVKQAERYKEMVELMEKVASAADSGVLTDEENRQISFAKSNAVAADIAYRRIIASIKEQKEENDDHVSIFRDLPTEIDPGLSTVRVVMLKIYDSRRIPFATSGLDKLKWLKDKTYFCSQLARVKTGREREEAIEKALSTFKAAQDIANAELAPSHPKRLELALALSNFHYEILNSPDGACSIAQQAVDLAMAEFAEGGKAAMDDELVALFNKAKLGELAVAPEAVNKLDTPEKIYNYSDAVNMAYLGRNIKMWTSMVQDKGVTEGKKKKKKSMTMRNRGKKEKKKQDDVAESSVTMASPLKELVKLAKRYKLDTPEKMYNYRVTVNMLVLCRNIKMWTSMMQDKGVQDDGAESSVTMASPREELVKQAERYKEMVELMEKVASAADSGELTDEENRLLSFANGNAMSAVMAYRRIIASIKEQNDDHVSIIQGLPTEIDPGLSTVRDVMLKIYDSRRIPFATSGLDKLKWLMDKTSFCSQLAGVKTGREREEAIEKALSTFKAAQDIANAELAPSHPKRLELALALSSFHYQILNSPDGACSIARQAVDLALAEFAQRDKAMYDELVPFLNKANKGELAVAPEAVNKLDTPEKINNRRVTMKMLVLCHNITMWTSMMQDTEGKEKKKQDDGGESSVITTPSNQPTAAADHEMEEASS